MASALWLQHGLMLGRSDCERKIMLETNPTFSPEEIAQAAQTNVNLFCFAVVAYAKAQALSPQDCWAFIGRHFALGWEQGMTVDAIARRAARNMVSAGCTLRALSGNEIQAEAVMAGWPTPNAFTRFGLTPTEADLVFDVFAPIAATLDCHYQWRRQGDTIVMTFTC